MDIGAIGHDTGQRSPYKSLSLQNPGRDDMFVGMVTTTTTAANANLAVQRATQLPVNDQRDIIKREFGRVLRYAADHPDAVVDAVEEFLGDVQFRHVNQATIFYTQLLRMATHPHAMADPVVRAAVLNRVVLRTGDSPRSPTRRSGRWPGATCRTSRTPPGRARWVRRTGPYGPTPWPNRR